MVIELLKNFNPIQLSFFQDRDQRKLYGPIIMLGHSGKALLGSAQSVYHAAVHGPNVQQLDSKSHPREVG